MKNKTICLLTGTIDANVFHNVGNRICDTSIRLQQYERSITRYIEYSGFDVIVFAENSGYQFDYKKFEELATDLDKQFEYVACPSYVEETIKCGKSFGEARLILDALERSVLLKEADVIYKCTGRIYLQNSQRICQTKNEHRNEFLVYMCKKWCFTNIFKFDKEDYLKYFKEETLKCNERMGKDIERVFYEVIEEHSENLDVGSFSVWPFFDGIQGATLEPYSGGSIERILRNVMCKLGFFTYGKVAAKYLKC